MLDPKGMLKGEAGTVGSARALAREQIETVGPAVAAKDSRVCLVSSYRRIEVPVLERAHVYSGPASPRGPVRLKKLSIVR